jgi:hypothetical protein
MKAIWVPTWRCGQDCDYCNYRLDGEGLHCFGLTHQYHTPELSPETWIEFFQRGLIRHVEITGGEPTQYAGLGRVLASLPAGMTFAITSNTLELPEDILPHDKCLCWTASFHYREEKKFLANLAEVNRRGFRGSVTLVATPENVDRAIETMRFFDSLGQVYSLHLAMYAGFDWRDHWPAYNKLGPFMRHVPDRYPMIFGQQWQFPKCSAGMDYCSIMPNGTLVRCYTKAVMSHEEIGTIDEPRYLSELQPCGAHCCFPCDLVLPTHEQ